MNEALCRYPAERIYSSQYTAFTRQIAEQTLALADAPTADEWVEAAIDPDYPLVVCTYDGVYGAQENEAEARWVASIAKVLRERLLDSEENGTMTHQKATKRFGAAGCLSSRRIGRKSAPFAVPLNTKDCVRRFSSIRLIKCKGKKRIRRSSATASPIRNWL